MSCLAENQILLRLRPGVRWTTQRVEGSEDIQRFIKRVEDCLVVDVLEFFYDLLLLTVAIALTEEEGCVSA